jgi:MFS family permease
MRVGGAPQHPVGNGLLAEQFPPSRRGFAISAHISGGNVGTVTVPLLGAWLIAGVGWRWTVVLFGIPAVLIALAILVLVKEAGTDRAAARAHGSVRDAFRTIRHDRDLLWLYVSSILGGGGRGLGVVNVFVPIYLSQVIGLDDATVALMYAVLVVFSVPAPLVAGWLSDRWGRKPLIVGIYVAGAGAFAVFLAAGSNVVGLWAGILLLGLFNFAESPQLQALLADIAPAGIRDASYAAYFTLAFGVGSLWVAVYGVVVELFGKATGLGIVFAMMAAAFLLAALSVLPIRADERAAAQARAEGS